MFEIISKIQPYHPENGLVRTSFYAQPYDTVEKLRKHTDDIFSPVACIYHYLHMAQKNQRKEKKSNTVKSYINILKPLLVASWIEKYGSSHLLI